jgi:hypothetical protein
MIARYYKSKLIPIPYMDASDDALIELMLLWYKLALSNVLENQNLESRLSEVEGLIDDVKLAKCACCEFNSGDASFDLLLNNLFYPKYKILEGHISSYNLAFRIYRCPNSTTTCNDTVFEVVCSSRSTASCSH